MASHKEDFERSLKALGELSKNSKVLEASPIDSFKAALDRRWKALTKEVSADMVLVVETWQVYHKCVACLGSLMFWVAQTC